MVGRLASAGPKKRAIRIGWGSRFAHARPHSAAPGHVGAPLPGRSGRIAAPMIEPEAQQRKQCGNQASLPVSQTALGATMGSVQAGGPAFGFSRRLTAAVSRARTNPPRRSHRKRVACSEGNQRILRPCLVAEEIRPFSRSSGKQRRLLGAGAKQRRQRTAPPLPRRRHRGHHRAHVCCQPAQSIHIPALRAITARCGRPLSPGGLGPSTALQLG